MNYDLDGLIQSQDKAGLQRQHRRQQKPRNSPKSKLLSAAWPKPSSTPMRKSQIKSNFPKKTIDHQEFAKSCSEWRQHAANSKGEHSIEDMDIDLDTDDEKKMKKTSSHKTSKKTSPDKTLSTKQLDENNMLSLFAKHGIENSSSVSPSSTNSVKRSTRLSHKYEKTDIASEHQSKESASQIVVCSSKKSSQALFIVIHTNKVVIGNMTGRATTPVKVYADKFMIQLENDATKKDILARISCKHILSLKMSLFAKPYKIEFTTKEIQYISGMSCARKSTGGQDSESVTLYLAYEDNVPKDIKDDLKELFKVRLAEQNLWSGELDEMTPVMTKKTEKRTNGKKGEEEKVIVVSAMALKRQEKSTEMSPQSTKKTVSASSKSLRKRTTKSNKLNKSHNEDDDDISPSSPAKIVRRTNFEMDDVTEERIKTLEHEAAHYQMLSAQQRMIIQSLETEIRQKANELENIREVGNEYEVTEKLKNDLEGQLKEELELVRTLEYQLESMRKELHDKDEVINEQSDAVHVRDETIQQLRTEMRRRSLSEKSTVVEKEETVSLSVMEETRHQLMQMQLSKESLTAELEKSRSDLLKSTSDVNTLRVRLQQVQNNLDIKSTSLLQLRADFIKSQEDIVRKDEEIRSLTNQTRQLNSDEVNRLRSELENIKTQLEQARSELSESQIRLSENQEIFLQGRENSRDWILERVDIKLSGTVIGVGAWGNVKIGTFRGTDVAVKQIHHLILSPHNRRLFEREMTIASRCRHPCLVQFIGATNDDGTPLFVMELMETDLRSVLSRQALEDTDCLKIGFDVIRALNYLHLSKPVPIIHRDISSSNVLLCRGEKPWGAKLSDYGAANFMRLSMTRHPGALLYSAPEASTMAQTTKLDVYSFGVLFCEMCIRELPVPEHRQEQIAMVTKHDYKTLITNCLHRDITKRLDSKDVLVDFNRWMQEQRIEKEN